MALLEFLFRKPFCFFVFFTLVNQVIVAQDWVPRSAKDVLMLGLSEGDGSYVIDPDGPGGAAAFEVECLMSLSGGGWTKLSNAVSATPLNTDASLQREYLYVHDGKWYRTPVSNLVWDWNSGKDLYGTYFYDGGSFEVTESGEKTLYGVSGSSGGGQTNKCLIIHSGGRDPENALVNLCQDKPGVFPSNCQSGVTVFIREVREISGIPGDVDSNGIVEMDDARLLARFLANQDQITRLENADITQDGSVDMQDAFAISKRVSGQSRIVVVAPRYGSPERLDVGEVIRIEVFEQFFPFQVTGGTVRIQSISTDYDSGVQALTFESSGRSLYYHWDTLGLEITDDYDISVTLTDSNGLSVSPQGSQFRTLSETVPDTTVALRANHLEPRILASVTDAYAPAAGFPLEFKRIYAHDSSDFPYAGPLGRGWVHSYDILLEEETDGRVTFRGPTGFGRQFTSNNDGTYDSSPGDYGVLTRDETGRFQLREKNGFIYAFRASLLLDFVQDRNGNSVTVGYDEKMNKVTLTHSSGPQFTLSYAREGMITSLTDHVGRETQYVLDPIPYPQVLPIGVVITTEFRRPRTVLKHVIDPSGAKTDYEYTRVSSSPIASGNDFRLSAIHFPDDIWKHYSYDENARIVRETGVWGANPVEYSYHDDGTTIITDAVGAKTTAKLNERGRVISISDPDNGTTYFEYDSIGNLTREINALNHSNQFSYDGNGNLTGYTNALGEKTLTTFETVFGQPISVRNALGKETKSFYDEKGNRVKVLFPDGEELGFDYYSNGRIRSYTDEAGNLTRFFYDSQGLLEKLVNPQDQQILFNYNSTGNVVGYINENGRHINITRDVMERVKRYTFPDDSHLDYEYDGAGNLTSFTNRRGQRIDQTYDDTGRLAKILYPEDNSRQFVYDDRGMLTEVYYQSGQSGSSGTVQVPPIRVFENSFEYDLSRRHTKSKFPGPSLLESYDVSRGYDATGNRTLLVYPDGYTVHYYYDAVNRLRRVADGTGQTISSYQYDEIGRRIRIEFGNGAFTTYEYNERNHVTEIEHHAPDGIVQSNFSYTLNESGIRTGMTTAEGTHGYGYDSEYQLTNVTYPDNTTLDYSYDPAGNRTSVTDSTAGTTSYAINELDQYTMIGVESLNYDKDGNLIERIGSMEDVFYDWDEDGRLVSVNRGEKVVEYSYDFLGRISSKSVNGKIYRYIWEGWQLIAIYNLSDDSVTRIIYGTHISDVVQVTKDGSKYWAHQDGIGSVVGMSNQNGELQDTWSFDEYGNIISSPNMELPTMYSGLFWDSDADLYYARMRWYSPDDGRFISPDPIGLAGGSNLYSYVRNSPINLWDPLGLKADLGALFELLIWAQEMRLDHYNAEQGKTRYWNEWKHKWEWGPTFKPGDPKTVWDGDGRAWTNPNYTPPDNSGGGGTGGGGTGSGGTGSGFGGGGSGSDFRDALERHRRSGRNWTSDGAWIGGGICPTFIQISENHLERLERTELISEIDIFGKIEVPVDDALLRSDIPVFGVAQGDQFQSYRVEIGNGKNPSSWTLVEASETAQEDNTIGIEHIPLMQGDIDIRGNLATWNSGLKNWEHLPWHPEEHTIDYNGVYTIRLVVEGKNGETVEDRVTCEVGRVIAQCLPGVAYSPDQSVALRFPEQALLSPFRVYTILPLSEVGEELPSAPADGAYLGEVYRIREPGDAFMKPVELEFKVDQSSLEKIDWRSVGICQYDLETQSWLRLETQFDEEASLFSSMLTKLPKTKAIYALIHEKKHVRSTLRETASETLSQGQGAGTPGRLVLNDFETDFGSFKERDLLAGARLERDNQATLDGSYCLKLVNENAGGNFSCTVLDRPFDVRDYPRLSFNYRVAPGVKLDLLLRVDGRWHNLGFTDDVTGYQNEDVNIANLGRLEGILADDQWHTASVDLQYLLSQKTGHTVVEEIMMADWNVGGYMKLEFGNNPRGATAYFDNFSIEGSGSHAPVAQRQLIDSFDQASPVNAIGGSSGDYCNPGSHFFETAWVADAYSPDSQDSKSASGKRSLQLQYNMERPNAYGGYWTGLNGRDLHAFGQIHFKLHSAKRMPNMEIGVRDSKGVESKASIIPYVSQADEKGWRDVRIPLSALDGNANLGESEVLFLSASHALGTGKGLVLIDELALDQSTPNVLIDFESTKQPAEESTDLFWTDESGAAAISAKVLVEPGEDSSTNQVCRISYGGTIGKDYGVNGGFSYALWKCRLDGFDARSFESITLRLRGEKGGETPNIYLSDGNRRICLRASQLPAITDQWQDVQLPLAFFKRKGVDISHLDTIQFVFEWEEQSGTVYVDDIRFVGRSDEDSFARN